MRLSRKATKFLRYLSNHTEFRHYYELEKEYLNFNEQHFWAIYRYQMLDIYPNIDLPNDPKERHNILIYEHG